MLLEEAAHLQTGAVADAPLPGPISKARSRLQQELLVLVLEKQLAETELESEQEEMVQLEVLLERVAAAGKGGGRGGAVGPRQEAGHQLREEGLQGELQRLVLLPALPPNRLHLSLC